MAGALVAAVLLCALLVPAALLGVQRPLPEMLPYPGSMLTRAALYILWAPWPDFALSYCGDVPGESEG